MSVSTTGHICKCEVIKHMFADGDNGVVYCEDCEGFISTFEDAIFEPRINNQLN